MGRDIDPSCPSLSRIGPHLFHFAAWISAEQMLSKERTGKANTGLGEGSDQLPRCNFTSWRARACARERARARMCERLPHRLGGGPANPLLVCSFPFLRIFLNMVLRARR